MSSEKSTSKTKLVVVPTADMVKPAGVFAQAIADKLGVCPEDIIVLNGVSSFTFAEIPADLLKAREKADADAKAKADAEAKAASDAEMLAAAKAHAEAAAKAKAEAESLKEIEAATKAELSKAKAAEKKAA